MKRWPPRPNFDECVWFWAENWQVVSPPTFWMRANKLKLLAPPPRATLKLIDSLWDAAATAVVIAVLAAWRGHGRRLTVVGDFQKTWQLKSLNPAVNRTVAQEIQPSLNSVTDSSGLFYFDNLLVHIKDGFPWRSSTAHLHQDLWFDRCCVAVWRRTPSRRKRFGWPRIQEAAHFCNESRCFINFAGCVA